MEPSTTSSPSDGVFLDMWVAGLAIAQPRHRDVALPGGERLHLEAYSSHRIHAYKAALRIAATQGMRRPPAPREMPIKLTIMVLFERPQRLLSKNRINKPYLHTSRPDDENLVKSIQDALTKVVWSDDCQVSTLIFRKRYTNEGEVSGVRIRVEEDRP